MMVTGQSAVLYSRLGVVLGPSYQTIRRIMKWIIIVDGVVLHTTTQVVMLGAWNAEANRTWAAAYKHVETIQMTIFTVQEFVLSGLYIWRAVDILKTSKSGRQPMRIMRELFTMSVLAREACSWLRSADSTMAVTSSSSSWTSHSSSSSTKTGTSSNSR